MRTLLLVEDNPLIVELLTELLQGDYLVITAQNGKRGVEMATKHRPDLILMDLTMPVMDGWEAIARLREEWATCRIPVIALTAVADDGEIARALRLGADAHLKKPIEDELLFETVARLLGEDRPSQSPSRFPGRFPSRPPSHFPSRFPAEGPKKPFSSAPPSRVRVAPRGLEETSERPKAGESDG